MLREILIALGVALSVVAFGFLVLALFPKDSACWGCPQIDCINSISCGYGCSCLVPPGEVWGSCWGTD